MTALVSVIIPTAGARIRFLRQAVLSALDGFPPGAVEVVVVANGNVDRLASVRSAVPDIARVEFTPEPNACAARNAGLRIASAPLVRFLDDDDYLEPSGAHAQCDALARSDVDACAGGVVFVNDAGEQISSYAPGSSGDMVCEVFEQRHSTMTVASVYRRETVRDLSWNEHRTYLQDVDWTHQFIRNQERRWISVTETVGFWRHHGGERLSVSGYRRSPDAAIKEAARIIEESIDLLDGAGRLSTARKAAAAKALWDYCHRGFPYSPIYWSHIATKARALDPSSRPKSWLMARWPFPQIDPILAEWILSAPRRVAQAMGIDT